MREPSPDQVERWLAKPKRSLGCACCGKHTYGRQWWNQDTGYGLCVECIPFVSQRSTPEHMLETYGVRGVHYGV